MRVRKASRSRRPGGGTAEPIVMAALPHVGRSGWTLAALAAGARDLGLGRDIVRRAFPGGPADAVRIFSDYLDREMMARLEAHGISRMRVRDRITLAVRIRLEIARPHRAAYGRTLSFLALPGRATLAARLLWRTASTMWYAAGDTSTDFSYYTRRMLLAGVYGSTVLHWLTDESPDNAETWAFLDRRIANVMAIPTLKPAALAERFAPALVKILLRTMARGAD